MDKIEKLIKEIMAEAEKDGEPVTKAEAFEMAKMELNAKEIKRYEQAQKTKKQATKKRTTKVSAEKQQLFKDILTFLQNKYENVEVATENKLIFVKIADKKFKIDLIQTKK